MISKEDFQQNFTCLVLEKLIIITVICFSLYVNMITYAYLKNN